MYTILLVIHTILVIFLIIMVLLQRTDSDGMAGLGGGGGNQFLTGRSQANLMTRTTAILAGLFMLTSLTLAIMASRMTAGPSIVDTVPIEAPKAEAPVAAEKKETPEPKAIKKTPAVPQPE